MAMSWIALYYYSSVITKKIADLYSVIQRLNLRLQRST